MATEHAIGFVRTHRRIGNEVQRSALNADGVRCIVEDRDALELMTRSGTVVKIRHLFLLADPKARKKPGGWRKDLLDMMDRLEKRGGIIKDVDTQLSTAKPDDRYAMVALAIEQLAGNGRIHLLRRRQGRKRRAYPDEVERAISKIWLNTSDYPEDADAEAAIAKIDKTYTKERARKTYGPRYKRSKQ